MVAHITATVAVDHVTCFEVLSDPLLMSAWSPPVTRVELLDSSADGSQHDVVIHTESPAGPLASPWRYSVDAGAARARWDALPDRPPVGFPGSYAVTPHAGGCSVSYNVLVPAGDHAATVVNALVECSMPDTMGQLRDWFAAGRP